MTAGLVVVTAILSFLFGFSRGQRVGLVRGYLYTVPPVGHRDAIREAMGDDEEGQS